MRSVSRRDESGMALITVFMVLMLASALMVGFFATIVADQKANGIDRDQTQAYAAAHAGLEKLTSSLASLFVSDYSPTKSKIDLILAKPPVIAGFKYLAPGSTVDGTGYTVTWDNPDPTPGPNLGSPLPDTATGTPITAGPYAGFKGIITRYPITVTARSTGGGAEVRLRRELQTVAVPVFQFGVFSETDLTFYAGANFTFGGRVQTNGNLFLSQLDPFTLTLPDRVTAYGEVVRANLSNGIPVGDVGFDGPVAVLDKPTGGVHTRLLKTTEGSVAGMPGSAPTITNSVSAGSPSWTDISTGQLYYKSLLRNKMTGAKYLSLPLVSQGAVPMDLIKRPPVIPVDASKAEHLDKPLIFTQRYFALGYPDNGTSLRILLSDSIDEIKKLPTIDTTKDPVALDATVAAAALGKYGPADATHPPLAMSPGPNSMQTNGTTGNGATDINVDAVTSFFYAPPLTIGVAAAVTCTGKTATKFTGCPNPLPLAVNGSTVTATVQSGAGTVLVTTTLTAAITATTRDDLEFPVVSTAAFAPGLLWVDDSGVDLPVTCAGYNVGRTKLTECSGITSALADNRPITTGALSAAGTSVINGFIKIEMLNKATPPVYVDITQEILNFGIAGPNLKGALCGDPTPDAIVRLQRLRDNGGYAAGTCATNAPSLLHSLNANDYWPNMLYDTREGNFRDTAADAADKTLRLGGMMGYVSLDVGNLKKWLERTAPYNAAPYNAAPYPNGSLVNSYQSGNGYVVYFSDRRNNKCVPGAAGPTNSCIDIPALGVAGTLVETGEYGYEDVVNSTTATGLPDAIRQTGEDVNAPVPVTISGPVPYVPFLDVYGGIPRNVPAPLPAGASAPLIAASRPDTTTTHMSVGMINRPILFRRALKLVNAQNVNTTTSRLPSPGLTVASENPIYVQGNYNAVAPTDNNLPAWATDTHMAASILADAVTLLSSNWNDVNSFQTPNDRAGRPAQWTAYRFAVVAGKGLSFPYAGIPGAPHFLFGTDGGVGNFLRLLEDWTPGTGVKAINYRGSIVSLYTSRQAVGTYKCCQRVYDYSLRNYVFDDDFLLPAKLPPGTPMFRDVNTLTFRQLLRPNQ